MYFAGCSRAEHTKIADPARIRTRRQQQLPLELQPARTENVSESTAIATSGGKGYSHNPKWPLQLRLRLPSQVDHANMLHPRN